MYSGVSWPVRSLNMAAGMVFMWICQGEVGCGSPLPPLLCPLPGVCQPHPGGGAGGRVPV